MLRRKLVGRTCTFLCAVILATAAGAAADIGPDPGFGTGGALVLPFGIFGSPELARDSQGNIVAVGEWVFPVSAVGVARISSQGRVDGTQGSWSVGAKFGFATAYAYVVAVDTQDRIVVGGVGNGTTSFVGRFLPSGAPDTSFGSNGVSLLPPNPSGLAYVSDIGVDSGDRVVALQVDRLVRLSSTGTIDSSFANGGVTGAFSAYRIAVAADGSITTAGQPASGAAGADVSVRRFDASGAPDNSFGSGGEVAPDFVRGGVSVQSFAVDSTGRILVGGGVAIAANQSAGFVARLTPSGEVDRSFGVDGARQIPGDQATDIPYVAAIDTGADGTIVAGGVVFRNSQTYRLLALLTDSGAFDPDSNGGAPLVEGDGTDRVASVLVESPTSFVVSAGKQASGGSTLSRRLLVRSDRTAPQLTLPADQTILATVSAGATASFAGLGAIDAVDPSPTVTCDASPATVFPIGVTVVTCTARDASGNAVTGTFRVTVVNVVPPAGGGGGSGGGGGGSNLPDLEVAQSASRAQATVGDLVTFTSSVILKNFAASSGASNLVLTDVLPSGLELVSVSTNRGSCVSAQTVVCNLNFIASGITAQVVITAKVVGPGEIVNSVSVRADETELDPANNVATVRLNSPVAVPVAPLAPPTVVKKPAVVKKPKSAKGITRTGTAKAETLRGTGRADTLDGRGGSDTIFGLGGNDLLVGGGGRDTIDAGAGDDTVRVRDGAKDTVRCGAGIDSVVADKIDVLVGCERITRR